jgi:hypothetical protein
MVMPRLFKRDIEVWYWEGTMEEGRWNPALDTTDPGALWRALTKLGYIAQKVNRGEVPQGLPMSWELAWTNKASRKRNWL